HRAAREFHIPLTAPSVDYVPKPWSLRAVGWQAGKVALDMARIAIGGFQHETNTFAPVKAGFADFEMADGWPGLTRGDALFEVFTGINLSLPGFIEQAKAQRHELLPLLWCSASPSAQVTQDAYE